MSTISLVAAAMLSASAIAGVESVTIDAPALDRWMYPFTGNGLEAEGRSFAALGIPGFDDRDSQFLVGFDTGDIVEPGQGIENYRVVSARLRFWISRGGLFAYDPSSDLLEASYEPGDPEYIADADTGTPIEVFGVGYRCGWDLVGDGKTTQTFEETTVFATCPPVIDPAEGHRNAFAATFDALGMAIDASNHVTERRGVTPAGIARSDDVEAGETVPAEAEFVVELDVCDPSVRDYLRRSLDSGRITLSVSSLHRTSQGQFNFPYIYTRDSALAQALGYEPKLELTLETGRPGDFNGDGALNIFDFLAFQTAFSNGDRTADYTGDCALNIFDFLAFQTAFGNG